MNLLNAAQSQISVPIIDPVSQALNESPDATRCGFDLAIAAVLGTLTAKSGASPLGATEVFGLVKQNPGSDADSASNLLSNYSLGGGARHPLLHAALGTKIDAAADFIAGHCRLKNGSAVSILNMAAPLVTNIIGRHASAEGLGASGLAQLLSSQAPFLRDALPAGLAGALGIGALFKAHADTTRIPDLPEEDDSSREARTMRPPPPPAPVQWAVPLILIALAGWFILQHYRNRANMGGNTDLSQRQTGITAGFRGLKLRPGGPAAQLAQTAAEGRRGEVIFFNAAFDGASALTDEGRKDVQQVGEVLRAMPEMRIQLIGFGATREEGQNQANTIRAELIAEGVAPARIEAEGEVGEGSPSLRIVR